MAVYKVPQDVEADDKLIGPFSFRQFIYLVIVALGMAAAWGLSQIFIGLIVLPLPIILFFGAIALPLRKDQPMEIYLAAMVKFFFKPRIRLWQPEGQINLVTIVAPHVNESSAAPALSRTEAQQRLSYLAQVIDTQGWAARGVTDTAMASLNDTITAEASTVNDMLDTSVGVGRQFDSLIEEQDAIRKQQVTQQFQSAFQQPPASSSPTAFQAFPMTTDDATYTIPSQPVEPASPVYDPYPVQMHQHVIDPNGQPPAAAQPEPQPEPVSASLPPVAEPTMATYNQPTTSPEQSASDMAPSPDIMRLASNKDLSISAIAREAHRLEQDEDEVVISLR